MNCDEVLDILGEPEECVGAAERRAAQAHLSACASCGAAQRATRALAAARSARPPAPPPGAVERAVRAAARQPEAVPAPPRNRHAFWLGAALGAAVAGVLALAPVLVPRDPAPPPLETPQVTLAPNESRAISISVDSPEPLPGAEIRVALTGEIGLVGFEGRKELVWQSDLDRGTNRLTLPVVALGGDGGQLVVEVEHRAKRKRFLVDVRAAARGDAV